MCAQHVADDVCDVALAEADDVEPGDARQEAREVNPAEQDAERGRERLGDARQERRVDDRERAPDLARQRGEQRAAAGTGATRARRSARERSVGLGERGEGSLEDVDRHVDLLEHRPGVAHGDGRAEVRGLRAQPRDHDGIDREPRERARLRTDLDHAAADERSTRIELARDGVAIRTAGEQVFDEELVDERAARVVREDAVQPREVAPHRRRGDHEEGCRSPSGDRPRLDPRARRVRSPGPRRCGSVASTCSIAISLVDAATISVAKPWFLPRIAATSCSCGWALSFA